MTDRRDSADVKHEIAREEILYRLEKDSRVLDSTLVRLMIAFVALGSFGTFLLLGYFWAALAVACVMVALVSVGSRS